MKKLALLSIFLTLPVIIIGCTQNETAALVQTLGTASASIATIEGNTSLATQLTADTNAAVKAIDNWTAGTPATEAVEAINIVIGDLSLFPVAGPDAAYVTLALGTAESIIDILSPAATPAIASRAAVAQRTVTLANPPKTAAQFKKAWNAIGKGGPKI